MSRGVLERLNAVAVHGFPLDWNHWQLNDWPARLAEIQAVTTLPVWVTEVGVSTFGAEEVQEFGLRRTAELLRGRAPRIHWYSLYDLPARLAGHHAPPRGGRLLVLPPLLHGAAARRRHAQARALARSASSRPTLGICQWFHFEDHRLDDAVALAAQTGRAPSAHRPELGRQLPPELPKPGSTGRWLRSRSSRSP